MSNIKVKKKSIETIKQSALSYYKRNAPSTGRDNLLAESYLRAISDWLEKEHNINVSLLWDTVDEDKDSLENS